MYGNLKGLGVITGPDLFKDGGVEGLNALTRCGAKFP